MSQIHRLCLGTASFGMAYPPGSSSPRPTHAESAEMLRYAYGRGVRWFDTARAYGDAEDICVSCLAPSVVVTKTAPDLREWVRTDCGMLLLHNPHESDMDIPADGVSVYSPKGACVAIQSGFDYIQIPYHVLDQRHAKAGVFEAAKAASCTVMARQPFARGEALRAGFSVEDCLRFALASPADLVVFGVSSMAQLQRNLDIAESEPPPTWPARYVELLQCDVGLDLASVCTPGRR